MSEGKFTRIGNIMYGKVCNYKNDKKNSDLAHSNCTEFGNIVFKQNKVRSKISRAAKGMALVLVASVSGAITSMWILQNTYFNSKQNYLDLVHLMVKPDTENINNQGSDFIKNIVEDVELSVVGISNSMDNFSNRTINQSTGSGVILNKDGIILTNYHIIEAIEKIWVKIPNANTQPVSATVVGVDKNIDLAVLKINSNGLNLRPIMLDSSYQPEQGASIIAIGNPFGNQSNCATGIISTTNVKKQIINLNNKEGVYCNMLQIDRPINANNTGGPLCNAYGQVIGINSIKVGDYENSQGMGFAIVAKDIKKAVDDILKNNKEKKCILGIDGKTSDEFIYKTKGVYLTDVGLGSCAWESGIRRNDIITQINDINVSNLEEVNQILEKQKSFDNIKCKVVREGQTLDFTISLKNEKN